MSHREQILPVRFGRATLEALLEAHVEQLEDHELVLDLVADARREEVRRPSSSPEHEQLDDVRVPLHALEELLLHLEAHLVLARLTPFCRILIDDRAAEVGLRLDPALLAEVGLGEAARAELDRQAARVEHERVRARARDVERRGAVLARLLVARGARAIAAGPTDPSPARHGLTERHHRSGAAAAPRTRDRCDAAAARAGAGAAGCCWSCAAAAGSRTA